MNATINMNGKKHTLLFLKARYQNNDNLAIQVLSKIKEQDRWEPWCNLTVNLPSHTLEKNKAFLDTNNCSEEIINWLLENGHANVIGKAKSGYCIYPLVEFSETFINDYLVDIAL